MAEIKVDLENQSLTVKTRRTLQSFFVDAEKDTIQVNYKEIQYTGTIGEEDYFEIKCDLKSYSGDKAHFDGWLASDSGVAIQAAVEGNLAKDEPGT